MKLKFTAQRGGSGEQQRNQPRQPETDDKAETQSDDGCCLPADELEAGPIRELPAMPNLYIVRVLA